MRLILIALISVLLLSGCAGMFVSDERLKSNTAGVLGVSPNDITIKNRTSEMTNVYYNAVMNNGDEYACTCNGGNILTMGMINGPFCTKKAMSSNNESSNTSKKKKKSKTK